MDKLEYLALMLNQRTSGKKYENFVINAIYARIANLELIPETQKYVKNPHYPYSDNKKYYLLDLYFPQLNYGIEVDEPTHEKQLNQELDANRANDILDAVNCKIGRIKIGKDEKTLKTIGNIDAQINNEVEKIKELIEEYEKKNNGKLSWRDEETRKEETISKGVFELNDSITYKGITEIYNIVGHSVENLGRGFVKLNNSYMLWCPYLAMQLDDGTVITRNGWKNTLNEDRTIIEEIPKDMEKCNTKNIPDGPWNEKGMKRIVFMHVRNNFGIDEVRFLGVFEAVRLDTIKKGSDRGKQKRTYKRIKTSVKINDLKP